MESASQYVHPLHSSTAESLSPLITVALGSHPEESEEHELEGNAQVIR
jgi:hypothetical protein